MVHWWSTSSSHSPLSHCGHNSSKNSIFCLKTMKAYFYIIPPICHGQEGLPYMLFRTVAAEDSRACCYTHCGRIAKLWRSALVPSASKVGCSFERICQLTSISPCTQKVEKSYACMASAIKAVSGALSLVNNPHPYPTVYRCVHRGRH